MLKSIVPVRRPDRRQDGEQGGLPPARSGVAGVPQHPQAVRRDGAHAVDRHPGKSR